MTNHITVFFQLRNNEYLSTDYNKGVFKGTQLILEGRNNDFEVDLILANILEQGINCVC